ncbi:alpha/beta fold hydrolase [Endozoicomonas atrinae]|uniref:alpha/beta fold hydrolase n=1 Tax=Endozoicomonas atrinae TaxID=1333660 RepID=UPI0015861DA6|nr:alpha/beta hydrolase [Endozoicomonas atrinae]
MLRFVLWGVLASIILSGCQSQRSMPEVSYMDFDQELKPAISGAGFFPIYTWVPENPSGSQLRIYIEGDGRAWLRSGRASFDPTPVNRLVHHLMMKDPFSDIAYLSQPCQYEMNSTCIKNVWTFERYSQKVIETMNHVVSEIKESGGYKTLELVGYSGGGAIAMLLAAKRDDVISIRTVAGNLAPHYTNQLHAVSEMPLALNPADYQEKLVDIPQVHFVGAHDSVIPEAVSRHYENAIEDTSCVTIKSIEADHQQGWINSWSQLLAVQPKCDK